MAKKKKDKDVEYVLPAFNKKILKKYILIVFKDNPQKSLNYKQISKKFGVKDTNNRKMVSDILSELKEEDLIIQESEGKYRGKAQRAYITGKIDLTSSGNGYMIPEIGDEDIFISQQNLKQALHGDIVKVYLFARRKNHKPEGEVIEIIERTRNTFVGVIEIGKNFAFLIADSRNMPYDIFIPMKNLNGAKDNQKAIVKITEWTPKMKNPVGEVVEVLGDVGNNDTEMHAILAEFDLPAHFPESLEDDARKIDAGITAEEIAQRRDFRDITTFTIDPDDAKDFDDALSIRKIDNGDWEVGVHIADVTHYVTNEMEIEKEAEGRATSVYLVDRVVPMLPEHLSNFICSLRPNEEKLTFSAVFVMDDNAFVKNIWFGKTIIKSDRRFTYDEAQNVIETKQGDYVYEMITLDSLAKHLRAQRFKEGAIAFDRVEPKFRIDEKGKPIDIYFREMKDANKLIEEFMLLANKKVAEFVGLPKYKHTPDTFVYRIHDLPDPEKLNNFADFIKRFGYQLKMDSPEKISASLNNLMTEVAGKPEQNVVEQLALRAMSKATYSTNNIGHYGLGFRHYTHFTSPIRRYPDMMVHRMLFAYLNKKAGFNQPVFEKKCKHSSDMEQLAAQAERASIKYKMVEYMQDKLGHIYWGLITGVTEWGIYVEIIENKIEGMVALKDIEDDYYVFDEKNYCLIGSSSNKKYQLGDKVQIQIIRTNLQRKQLDFILYKEP